MMERIRSGEGEGTPKKGRGTYSEEDLEVIKTYFDNNIQSGTPPSIYECREFLRQHPLQRDAKQVRDKVRNIVKAARSFSSHHLE